MAKTIGDITAELSERVLGPAKAEAEKLLADASAEAGRILAAAREEAARVRAAAAKDAEDVRKQMEIDLQMAARNFILTVQERLEKAIVTPTVSEAVEGTLNDAKFMERVLESLIVEFNRRQGGDHPVEVLLPEKQRNELETWFLTKFREKAIAPLIIHFTDKISFGFKIGIAGQGSHFNFGDGLVDAVMRFCSPRFRNYFFRPSTEN
jgi:V/A-type H+-transporting ATPase subunit E